MSLESLVEDRVRYWKTQEKLQLGASKKLLLFTPLPKVLHSIQQIVTEYITGVNYYLSPYNIYSIMIHNKICLWFNSHFHVFNHQCLFNLKITPTFSEPKWKFPGNLWREYRHFLWIKNGFMTLFFFHLPCWSLREMAPHERKSAMPILGSEIQRIYNKQLQMVLDAAV